MTATVIVAAATVAAYCYHLNAILKSSMQSANAKPEYVVGQSIDLPGTENSEVLLLGISPTCSWCKKDIPFYNEIGKSRRVVNRQVRVVSIIPKEFQNTGEDWLKANGIPGYLAVSKKDDKFPFRGTPTLVLVKDKKVLWVHLGGTSSEVQAELLKRLE